MLSDKKCEDLLDQGKYAELLEYSTSKLSFNYDSEEYLFYKCLALAGVGQLEKSDASFTKLFGKSKKYLYLICRGLVRFLGGNRESGKADFHEAIQNDSNASDLIFAFKAALKSSDLEDAEEALLKASDLDKALAINEVESFFEEMSKSSGEDDRLMLLKVMKVFRIAFSG